MNNDFESNEYDNLNKPKPVDIRIILTNMDYIEAISKAVSNFDLSNFNVNISSIIPTQDLEIAKNTIIGADLVLIAAMSDLDGKNLFNRFKKALKTDYNYIEFLKLPSLEELNDYDYDYDADNTFEDEIANSIIRAGLYSISNLSSINESKRNYYSIKKEFDNSRLRFDKIKKENDVLLNESKSIREKNEKLIEEVKILQKDLDSIKSDYSDLKSRFESIHSRNFLEVYSLKDLWMELFNESMSEEIYRFVLISTDNFRPKNLMIGQGVICAESKEDALDWLKIIKTAFILNDTNKNELDFNNFNSNFKFEEIDSLKSDSSLSESRFDLDSLSSDNSLSSFASATSVNDDAVSYDKPYLSESDDNSDEFIYNERYEGNDNSHSEFRELDFNNDFDLNEDSQYSRKNDDDSSDEINVFKLRSLRSLKDDEEDDSLEEDSYDYDDEDVDENEDELFNSFSNLWD